MTEHILIGLAAIIVLGVVAQWLAWRLHLPAILLLLVCGFAAGPLTGILHPDKVFGELLFPLVSVSVAIILFEGGLNLRIKELQQSGRVVRNLTTIGILITWLLTSLAAYLIGGLDPAPALLIGAVLVVSGPTVIIPLLRQVRPKGRIGTIIKWEGIVNDPLGAILAVLVFQVIVAGGIGEGTLVIIFGGAKALIFGSAIGLVGAVAIVLLLRRYLIPDFLQNPVSLMVVVMCYVAANAVQLEAGLLAVTVMGIALANQRFVSIRHILEFKENLRVLLISSLFIILAARLPSGDTLLTNISGWIFVAVLIVIVRPVMVYLSTLKSGLTRGERLFLSWMAPRGVVAAAVISIFALRLAESGFVGAEGLSLLTFQVIIGTVAVYGLTALPVARWLKVAQPNPQGILFAGAHPWARELARIMRDEGFAVALVDSNWENVTRSRSDGCRAQYASILSENLHFDLSLEGIGRLFSLTPNDEVNSLAALHYLDIFGRSEVYQLPPANPGGNGKKDEMPRHLHGRYLFAEHATFDYLEKRFRDGAVIKRTPITEEFDYEAFKTMYGHTALPLLSISETSRLYIYTTESPPSPEPGRTLISIVDPIEKPQ